MTPELALFETPRLVVRSFAVEDGPVIHGILDRAFGDGSRAADPAALGERAEWVRWSALSHRWFPLLHQPPFGDRAIVLKDSGELIGAAGFVPMLAPFGQIPGLGRPPTFAGVNSLEFGLFWAVDPMHQRRGYASEAGQGLIRYAFGELGLERLVATTDYNNLPSQAVMRKLGMRIERNPLGVPEWLQIVGVIENPGAGPRATTAPA